jgi:hypothetical protein
VATDPYVIAMDRAGANFLFFSFVRADTIATHSADDYQRLHSFNKFQ